ncbi:hypothetical protein B0J17DRAFT_723507 [Rhizoctonia solani]|nr:hypothetical protein B0J17DRAFT_723507 [Rhizoctonia solani]
MIVSTPIWTDRAPDYRAYYFSPRWETERTTGGEFNVLPRHSSIPKSIPPDPSVVSNALPFVSCQCLYLSPSLEITTPNSLEDTRMIRYIAFGVPPPSIMVTIMQRLSISTTTFASVTLGARILQSMIDFSDKTDWMAYGKPVDNLHSQACITPEEGSGLICTRGRLTAAIELTGYKFFLSNNISGYSFLKRTVPLVTRVASYYPQIWTKQGKIFTQKVLDLGVLELCYFVWADTMASTLLGTSPLLRYDSSICEGSNPKNHLEWMNGSPQEFIVWFSRLNDLRASKQRNGGEILVDWEKIEKDIQALETAVDRTECSSDNVARLAVVCGWKNALLIYLYVGVYGVNSSDSRVQSAVKQVIQLALVQHRTAFKRHLLAPAIFAGACARLESQRRSIMCIISSRRCSQMWILQISDFVFVLQHLWHGAAKDGRPITWDDYLRSRRAILRISE